MSKTFVLFRRELGVYFYSTLASSVFCVFLATIGFLFLQIAQAEMGNHISLPAIMFKIVFYCWLPIIITFLSMQFFAEERKNGQLEQILTLPVTVTQLIAAKFAAAFLFLQLIVLSAVGYVAYVESAAGGSVAEIAPEIMGGFLLALFFAMFALSVGMLAATLASNQVLAATITFVLVLTLYFLGYVVGFIPVMPSYVKEFLDFPGFIDSFSSGIVDSRPLVLCLTGTIVLLFFAVRIMETSKHK